MENCSFGKEERQELSGWGKRFLFGKSVGCSVIPSGTFLAPHWGAGWCYEVTEPGISYDMPDKLSRNNPNFTPGKPVRCTILAAKMLRCG